MLTGERATLEYVCADPRGRCPAMARSLYGLPFEPSVRLVFGRTGPWQAVYGRAGVPHGVCPSPEANSGINSSRNDRHVFVETTPGEKLGF